MSESLLSTYDGIVQGWGGEKTGTPPAYGWDDEAYLDTLLPATQGALLFDEMRARFSMTAQGEAITVAVCGEEFVLSRQDPSLAEHQLYWVRAYADLRGDRMAEILVQVDDIMSAYGALGMLDAGRRRRTLMLLTAVRALAIAVEGRVKFHCRAPRPIDLAPEVQPVIQTPDHSSFPSGHATEAFAIATVLHRLMTDESAREGIEAMAQPFLLAHRVAANRQVAGVHFPVDSIAGALLGIFIGEAVRALATGKCMPHPLPNPFEGPLPDPSEGPDKEPDGSKEYDPGPDFLLGGLACDTNAGHTDPASVASTHEPDEPVVLKAIWGLAASEWVLPGANE